jgi:hypothetical protein
MISSQYHQEAVLVFDTLNDKGCIEPIYSADRLETVSTPGDLRPTIWTIVGGIERRISCVDRKKGDR